MGDSLSAGYGIDLEQSWPSLLQKKLQTDNYPYRVVNDSISGNTTSNGLARLPQALKKNHPVITIIALGGNDGLRGLQITVIERNLNEMIKLAKESGSKVLVIGLRLPPNYGPAYTQAFENIFSDLEKRSDIAVIPFFLQDVDIDEGYFQSDRVHPTAKAQTKILNNIWPKLQPMLLK